MQKGLDAESRVVRRRHGRDVGDLVLDGGLPDVGVVVLGAAADRRVDDEVHFAVGDGVDQVRSSFQTLQHRFGFDAVLVKIGAGAFGREDLEAKFLEERGGLKQHLVVIGDRHQNSAFRRELLVGRDLRLEVGETRGCGDAQDFAGASHFRSKHRVDFREHVEGEDGFLDAVVRDGLLRDAEFLQSLAKHYLRGDPRHRDGADLTDERNGAGGPGVRFQNVDDVVADRVLDVHQSDHVHFQRQFLSVALDRLDVLFRNGDGRDEAGGVAGVDAGLLDVLHDGGNKSFLAVADGVGFRLGRVLKELVDEDDVLAGGLQGIVHVLDQHLVVVHDFHAAPAQNEGGTHHQGVAYPLGGFEGVLDAVRHAGFRLRNAELLHDFVEELAVFRQSDRFRRCAKDLDAVGFKVVRQIKRSLPAELDDDAHGFFLAVDGQNVFQSQRLEVKFVGSVVVGRNGLGVAVDHDGLKPGVPDRESGVHAAVVELDALADAVRPAAQDHDLVLGRNFRLVLLIIS